MTIDRPTLFLSSTVYDFADLRSALKDYLELRGCRVLASEYTDFTHPLDKHSYEACLATVEQADLFVLFVGRRVGGWLDEPNKISITRAEYRRAYELAKVGRIRILCFVRSDVWSHRQSVSDLAKALKADQSLSEEQRQKLMNHPSLAMENAEAIISFINEIVRNKETAASAKGLAVAPIANWIWAFETFTQVRQAIDPLVLNGLAVRDAAGRKALERQLFAILMAIVPRTKSGALDPVYAVVKMVKELDLNSGNVAGMQQVAQTTWNRLIYLLTLAMNARVDPAPLQSHLSSGLLLEYDPLTGSYRQTAEFDLLVKLIDQSELLNRSSKAEFVDLIKYKNPIDSGEGREVPVLILTSLAHRLLRWVDVIQTAKSLTRSLSGKSTGRVLDIPRSPILDQNEQLAAEAMTPDLMHAFIDE